MSEETTVTVERRGHVLLMGLNRPARRNAFTLQMFEQLALAYGELERNPDLRCGVLFAHGDHFTGGLEDSPSLRSSAASIRSPARRSACRARPAGATR
jgi:enoyl-CoA hydratase